MKLSRLTLAAGALALAFGAQDALAQTASGTRPTPDLDRVFDHLDTDQDGVLSQAEYDAAGGQRPGAGQRPGGGQGPGAGAGGQGGRPGGQGQGGRGRRGRRGGPGGGQAGPGGGGQAGPGGGQAGPGGGGQAGPGGRGRRPGGRMRAALKPPFDCVDADSSGDATRDEFKDGMRDWRTTLESFRTNDADQSKTLDASEWSYSTAFADVDTDGDGSVTHREFIEYLRANCSI